MVDVFLFMIGQIIATYPIAFLVNLMINFKSRKKRKAAQNVLGIALLIALSISSTLLIYQFLRPDWNENPITGRITGPYSMIYVSMLIIPVILIVLNSTKRWRTSLFVSIISCLSSFGYWMEKFVIIVTSIHRDLL